MGIYKNIQDVCHDKGVSVRGMENSLGFGRGSIYKWDTSQPGIQKVKAVADYLGVGIDDLVYGKAENEKTD